MTTNEEARLADVQWVEHGGAGRSDQWHRLGTAGARAVMASGVWRDRAAAPDHQAEAPNDVEPEGPTLIDELNGTINWLKRRGDLHDAGRVQRAVAALAARPVVDDAVTDQVRLRVVEELMAFADSDSTSGAYKSHGNLVAKDAWSWLDVRRAALRAALGGDQ